MFSKTPTVLSNRIITVNITLNVNSGINIVITVIIYSRSKWSIPSKTRVFWLSSICHNLAVLNQSYSLHCFQWFEWKNSTPWGKDSCLTKKRCSRALMSQLVSLRYFCDTWFKFRVDIYLLFNAHYDRHKIPSNHP